jgi:integrase
MASITPIKDPVTGKPLRWYGQINLGRHPVTKKPRFISKTCRLKTDVEAWVTQMQGDRHAGRLRATTDTKLTLAEYLQQTWLPNYATQVRNIYNVEKVVGKWLLTPRPDTPFLGCLRLRNLTAKDFTNLYRAMTAQGLRPRAITHLHGLVKRALKAAVREHELTHNPADGATIPKPDVQAEITSEGDEDVGPVEYLTHDQAVRFLVAAKTDRLSALWHLLLDAGLRPGEAFALQWRHVDFERGMVKVRGTLARQGVPKRQAGGLGWKVTKPKTASSSGDVPLSATTQQELRRWKKQQATERLQVGSAWQDHGFVFTTETGTPLGNNLGRAWARILAQADAGKGDLGTWGPEPQKPASGPTPQRTFTPRVSPYVLRHTCATLALLDGVDLLQVSRRLRHKNITITAQFYGHLKAEHTTQVADSFQRLAAGVQ